MNWLSPRPQEALVILDSDRSWSSSDLVAAGELLRGSLAFGSQAQFTVDSAARLAVTLVGLQGWANSVALQPRPSNTPPDDPRVQGKPELSEPVDTRWILFTSGTTGEPKPIAHTFSSLTRTVHADPTHARTWGMLYEPARMAGLQVVAQVLVGGGRLIAPDIRLDIRDRVRMLRDNGVDSLSATPSMWRRILQTPESRGWPLTQVTLGGEIADQKVLDALDAAFPDARITHVFAATETAAAFSVKDGREGFPISYLEQPPKGIRLDVRDNLLYVLSPGVEGADDDGFVCTGDVVELRDDRVIFKGRDSGVVNIAGAKVFPEQVETLLRTHPSVIDALVQSVPNAFSGSILVADVVLADGSDPQSGREIRSWLRGKAPSHWVPARIKAVGSLATSSNGKALRT